MNSADIVKAYNATLSGQQLLFVDDDIILRNTPFQSVNPTFDREAIAYWWMRVYVPEGRGDLKTPQQVFSSWYNAVYLNFRYIALSGYQPATNQQAVRFCGYKSQPLQPQVDDLNLWLPHIIPSIDLQAKDTIPSKYVGIFEHGLSEYGSYSMRVFDNEARVQHMRYHGYYVDATFPTVVEAVAYIVENHYYEE